MSSPSETSLAGPSTTSLAPGSTNTNSQSIPSCRQSPNPAALALDAPLAATTPGPTPCTPAEVVIVLSTTIIIKDYPLYYFPTPISSFQPTWRPLPDGSLIAPPYDQDFLNANLNLFVLGAVAAVFIRNILASVSYLRRGKVKRKTLFYLLLFSQLLAPFSLTPVIISHFWNGLGCNLVAILSYSGSTTSLGILITGILGLKAYKCLENTPLVPIVMGIVQVSTTAVVVAELIAARTFRRLTGSCVQTINEKYTRFFVGLQVVQALFVCFCFGYASYRSRKNPAARGRISLRMSMEDTFELPPFVSGDAQQEPRRARGWWDYVPKRESMMHRQDNQGEHGFFANILEKFQEQPHAPNAPFPIIQERKNSTINLIDLDPSKKDKEEDQPHPNPFHDSYGRRSPAPSTNSRFSRIFPRMELFRKVLNDELLYTTVITVACLAVATLVAISVNFRTGLDITGWIAIMWAFISLLVVHSLGRVVHRHERETWIQQSAFHTRSVTHLHNRQSRQSLATRASRSVRTSYSTGAWRPSISSKYKGLRERRHRSDPDEAQPLDQERFSWQFGNINPFQDPSPSAVSSPPLTPSSRHVLRSSELLDLGQLQARRASRNSQGAASSSGLLQRTSSAIVDEVPRT
ncbi:hypothetical protein BKA70DRAFT_1395109 [Coprinopsis sp. MPI-PUGE-AT-0042]|nr:hypothetical protein BKA70DRAFT_1395109 [Coprinopsis sp. MPI-PUGE-AT-0042]